MTESASGSVWTDLAFESESLTESNDALRNLEFLDGTVVESYQPVAIRYDSTLCLIRVLILQLVLRGQLRDKILHVDSGASVKTLSGVRSVEHVTVVATQHLWAVRTIDAERTSATCWLGES